MLEMYLDSNDWEADYFISVDQQKTWTSNPRLQDNLYLECAERTNFIKRKANVPGLLKGTIPGCERTFLLENKKIEDPYYARNLDLTTWVEDKAWAFRKYFSVPKEWKDMDRILLTFKGLDYRATIILNEIGLVKHEGMFIPLTLDVTDIIDFENPNLLCVNFEVAPHGIPNHYEHDFADFAAFHRTQMSFGWDWSRRCVTTGIWDSVVLTGYKIARISDCFANYVEGKVDLSIDIESMEEVTQEVNVSISPLNHNGKAFNTSFTCCLEEGKNEIKKSFTMEDIQLWYPNLYGPQNLYTLEVKTSTSTFSRQIGFKNLKMKRNKLSPEDAYPLTFEVNNQKVFARGINYVPADLLFAKNTKEDYHRLVKLAAEAGFNLIRMWGGGMVEKDAFYDACDYYGIMVWHEFMHACSNYPKDAEYLAFKRREGEAIIRKLRNHVAISMWCGGNEMQYYGEIANSPLLLQYEELVKKLVPNAPYHVSCPDLSRSGERNHGPWTFKEHSFYNKHFRLLASELGCNGMPEFESLQKFIPQDEIDNMQGNSLKYHFFIDDGAKSLVAPAQEFNYKDMKTLCWASMQAQADVAWYSFTHYRRLFPKASGVFFWQYNEPWPTCAFSLVDYYSVPKMAYYALKKANSPVVVSIEDESWIIKNNTLNSKVYLTRDLGEKQGVVSIKALASNGTILFEKKFEDTYKEGTTYLGTINETIDSNQIPIVMVFCTWNSFDGKESFSHMYLYGNNSFNEAFNLPKCQVEAKLLEKSSNKLSIQVKNISSNVALNIRCKLEGVDEKNIYYSDNYFTIAPNESIELNITGAIDSNTLSFEGWNLDKTTILV
jgi:beta-mannosidase